MGDEVDIIPTYRQFEIPLGSDPGPFDFTLISVADHIRVVHDEADRAHLHLHPTRTTYMLHGAMTYMKTHFSRN